MRVILVAVSALVFCISTPAVAQEWTEYVNEQDRFAKIQLTNNADQSRTFAGVFMHVGKLYIAEGTVPAGYPAPDFFRNSLGFLDENGDALRYMEYYRDGFPVPPLR